MKFEDSSNRNRQSRSCSWVPRLCVSMTNVLNPRTFQFTTSVVFLPAKITFAKDSIRRKQLFLGVSLVLV